jgi:hypothetical protein
VCVWGGSKDGLAGAGDKKAWCVPILELLEGLGPMLAVQSDFKVDVEPQLPMEWEGWSGLG